MPHRPTLWGRRALRALTVSLAVVGTAVPAAVASASGAPTAPTFRDAPGVQAAPTSRAASEKQAAPRIVGGTVLASNASAPYTVAIQTQFGEVAFGGCSGTVLDALHVLTAAHCFVRDGLVSPAANIRVGAGYHEIVSETGRASVTVVDVAAVRIHPLYDMAAFTDDVAVLTLATPLDLSTGRIAALPMVPVGSPLNGGSRVRVTGFGVSSALTNDFGTLRSVNTRSQFPSLCGVDAPAVMLCTYRAGHAACEGDSGGTAAINGGKQLVGVTNTAVKDCAAGLNLFANVAAPEIRTFIDAAVGEITLTADQIPVAPRGGRTVRVSGTVRPGRTVTCLRGTWTGSKNRYRYSFLRFKGNRAQSTAMGKKRTYRVRSADRGWRLSCAVEASNVGGSGVSLGRTLRAVN